MNVSFIPVAQSLPWTLVRGDLRKHLQQLQGGPKPTSRTAGDVWENMHLGTVAIPILISMLELLPDTLWSTVVVEQLHGTIAAL